MANKAVNGTRKRYNMVLPSDLFNQVKAVADDRQETVADILRKLIKIGLSVVEIDRNPNSFLIIREEGIDQRVVFL